MADLSCDDSINVGTPAQPQSQAMGAARRDPRRGEIPVTHSQVRFLFLPLPGEVVSGIQAIKNTYQISEGSCPAAPLWMQQGSFFMGGQDERKCKLLRHCSAAEATGGSWLLYKEGSCQDCGPDCKTDRRRYYFLAVISDSSSYLRRSVVMFVADKGR